MKFTLGKVPKAGSGKEEEVSRQRDDFLLLCDKELGLGLIYILGVSLAKSEMLPGELNFLTGVQGPLPDSLIIASIY